MNKVQDKQIFTTFDSFSVLALITGALVLVGSIISNAMVDQRLGQAKSRTRQLALEIAAGGYRGLQKQVFAQGQERGPASSSLDLRPEGRIGMDPWGSPYYYKMTEGVDGELKVTVLSSGPNRIRETFDLGLV
ncbi:MAG: hypothetical protein KDD38_08305, partial [Bdellovibrionales bacterium]|nr:hypothetical protein [Bdellovibrionales bacterium]